MYGKSWKRNIGEIKKFKKQSKSEHNQDITGWSHVSPKDVDRPTQISPESMPLQWDYQDTPRHTSQKAAHSAALCTGTPAAENISKYFCSHSSGKCSGHPHEVDTWPSTFYMCHRAAWNSAFQSRNRHRRTVLQMTNQRKSKSKQHKQPQIHIDPPYLCTSLVAT